MADTQSVALASRPDVFHVDKDKRILYLLVVSAIVGILLGLWMMTLQKVDVVSDYFEKLDPMITAKLVVSMPTDLKEEKKEEKKEDKKKNIEKIRKQLKASQYIGSGSGTGPGSGGPGKGTNAGKGDIQERVTQKGLLAIITGKAKSSNVAGTAYMGNVFAKDLDDVLNHIGGLKTSGKSGMGRMGTSSGKFNMGYAGNGGGGGGIDDLLGELAGGGASARTSGSLTRRATVELPTSKEFWSSEDNMAGRSPDEIRRVVMQHIGGLRAEYNKRLRSNPMLKGKIVVRFTIDPPGRVIRCELVNSTMNDKILEISVVSRVQSWQFEACGRCGTATVTYPFAFSQ